MTRDEMHEMYEAWRTWLDCHPELADSPYTIETLRRGFEEGWESALRSRNRNHHGGGV